MQPWTIREAITADTATLATLIEAAFAEYRGRLDPPSGAHDETTESLTHRLAGGGAFLAVSEGAPLGCVFYEPGDGYVHASRLAVLPAYRSRGLGRALLEAVEGRARAAGVPRTRLGVRIALERQRAYYERLGYRAVAAVAHAGYTQPTYLVMEKGLT